MPIPVQSRVDPCSSWTLFSSFALQSSYCSQQSTLLARFCPPGRNRAAEIISARAAEIPFAPSFSPMGRNCLVVHGYRIVLCFSSRWGTFFTLLEAISWLTHQLAYAQSMGRGGSEGRHHCPTAKGWVMKALSSRCWAIFSQLLN